MDGLPGQARQWRDRSVGCARHHLPRAGSSAFSRSVLRSRWLPCTSL